MYTASTPPPPWRKLERLLCHYFIILIALQVSVSCGIPDFRSRDGIYAKLSVEYPDLPDPQAMFDISYFYQNPRPFFKFAKVSLHCHSVAWKGSFTTCKEAKTF